MALDFSSISQEITYWLSHIGQNYSPSRSKTGAPLGEWGIDVTLPLDTPVYAVASGPVLAKFFYGGGGVVSTEEAPGTALYYQHLDNIAPGILSGAVTRVQAGQLIGWSGGQNVGGSHPSTTEFSTWPHIEVGVNAPWKGWQSEGQSQNPIPLLASIGALSSGVTVGENPQPAGCQNNTFLVGWVGTALCNLSSQAQNLFSSIVSAVVQILIRIGVILAGAVLIFLALRTLLRDTAGG